MGRAEIPTFSIVMEVVENPLLVANDVLLGNLCRLREAGVKIAVDDFGSGYSNLRHLTQLPVDLVKLDKSFLADLDGDESRARLLLRELVRMCDVLGYRVACEGVETAVQAAFVRASGARYAQGFYYGKAVPLEEVPALILQLAAPTTASPTTSG